MRSVAAGLTVVLALAAASAGAQTVPRTRDGHPDLDGIWQALNTAVWNLQDHGAALGVPAGQGVVIGGEIPYLPSALVDGRLARALGSRHAGHPASIEPAIFTAKRCTLSSATP